MSVGVYVCVCMRAQVVRAGVWCSVQRQGPAQEEGAALGTGAGVSGGPGRASRKRSGSSGHLCRA